jgi:amidophosphoribosyltransferase
MAHEAGAEKVYFASAAPEIRYPNVYGIDMPSSQELIAYGKSVDEVCTLIRAEGLIYQSLEDLEKAVRMENPELKEFETSVFNGVYITNDIDENYLNYLDKVRNDDAKADKAWNDSTENLEIYNES